MHIRVNLHDNAALCREVFRTIEITKLWRKNNGKTDRGKVTILAAHRE